MSKALNVLTQAIKPARLRVILRKVLRRITREPGSLNESQNRDWLKRHCTSFEELASRIDSDLWIESVHVAAGLEERAFAVLKAIPFDLGGGGIYPFLYFITRLLKPDFIVETGVAAGYSSYSFLAALRENNWGTLHSSDFPYFRLPQPERFIGIIVEDSLKHRWRLLIDGDEVNLPKILDDVPRIDIFHYDSDKSYEGRERTMAMVMPRMSPGGIILMDDIQDNSYFFDLISHSRVESWRVFEFMGKYVGMIGTLPGDSVLLSQSVA